MAIRPDYTLNAFKPAEQKRGRKRTIDLTDDQKNELAQIYLATNRNKKSGSMTLAWDVFAEQHPELGWDRDAHTRKHTLPAVAVEVMKRAKPLVKFHRGGEKKLRESAFQPGRLRRQLDGSMLRAGQRASWDDATINFGVVVPWPWRSRGDKCAEKYGVKLGRFQLLACHDDATSFIPTWSYVIRFEQSYRAEDVATAMYRTSRDVGIFDSYVLEGGVWKSHQVQNLLSQLKIQHINAQGRPQCKLVENFFNRLWSVLSVVPGQVGRYQAENKATSDLYVACRNGRKDPRDHFPTLDQAMRAIEWAINRLNNTVLHSAEYGDWTPQQVWERDLAEKPMRRTTDDFAWLAAPARETRTVVKGQLRATVQGMLGVPQRFTFAAPWLYTHEGQKMTVHFDPMGEWPIKATVTDKTGKAIGIATCVNPENMGGTDEDLAKITRKIMRNEYRLMTTPTPGKETSLRALQTSVTVAQNLPDDGKEDDDTPEPREALAKPRRTLRETIAEDAKATRHTPGNDKQDYAILRRRAAATQSTPLNW